MGDIPNSFSDISFGQFLNSFRLEWWRYTPLNYFIATPDSYDPKTIFEQVKKSYPGVVSAVFEVNVLDWYGTGPIVKDHGREVSFLYWFEKITDKDFKPAWERSDIDRKYVSPIDRLVLQDAKSYNDKSGNT